MTRLSWKARESPILEFWNLELIEPLIFSFLWAFLIFLNALVCVFKMYELRSLNVFYRANRSVELACEENFFFGEIGNDF